MSQRGRRQARRPRAEQLQRHQLRERYDETVAYRRETVRELVLKHRRLDILAEFVLGYDRPLWFQQEMIDFQDAYQEGLILGWRGCRKTTYLTITRCILEILLDPDVRILIVSDAAEQAQAMLTAIKSHLESNETLLEHFGDYRTGAKHWSDTKITVNKRRAHYMEPTVLTAGIGTALPSKHFDLILTDDLVTDDNSQTEGTRKRVHNYFYKTLFPTLISPTGRMYVIGTRWHDDDFYGHLAQFDYKDACLTIPVLDEETDQSVWEELFPTKRMHRVRTGNLHAFELQYMCRSGVGEGGIFVKEHFLFYHELPSDCFVWQAVDLAAGEKDQHAFFAHVTIAVQRTTTALYLLSYRKLRIPFPKQVQFIADRYHERPDTIAVGVETNAYQSALRQQMRVSHPDVPTTPRYTGKDKIVRANKRAMLFTDNPLHVRIGHHDFVRMMRGFPGLKGSKDLFDALDIALDVGMRGKKKRREADFGLL